MPTSAAPAARKRCRFFSGVNSTSEPLASTIFSPRSCRAGAAKGSLTLRSLRRRATSWSAEDPCVGGSRAGVCGPSADLPPPLCFWPCVSCPPARTVCRSACCCRAWRWQPRRRWSDPGTCNCQKVRGPVRPPLPCALRCAPRTMGAWHPVCLTSGREEPGRPHTGWRPHQEKAPRVQPAGCFQ